mgnify:CR=1 FL=1
MKTLYPWQENLWQHLRAYRIQERIPQALLVTGMAGIGKRDLVEAFARTLLCRAPLADHTTCGHCQGCTLQAAHTHPDFMLIEPDEPGKAIGIDKIRQLIIRLALKPQFETYRVVVISPAEQLNNASANAFLKCLEEPTERTCLILLTEKPARLPATIRSRCQTLHCPLPEPAIALQWLQQQGVREQAELVLNLAQGAPLLARHQARENWLPLRQTYFETWLKIAEGKANLVAVAEAWQKSDALDLAVVLRWMLNWVADIVKIAHAGDEKTLHNPDLKKSLQALAERLELQRIYPFYDNLLLAQAQLHTQINKQLMLEQLLIAWSQLSKR